jgi:hypothetical protein
MVIKSKARQYQLRIELDGVTPVIWRTIWVEGDMSLIQLHHIVQATMGWSDAHLHQFIIKDRTYATPHPEDDPGRPIVDERKVRLEKILDTGLDFEYHYDFGDGWTHRISVMQVKPLDRPNGAGYVEAGEHACPPEDSGGAHLYQEFLDQRRAKPGSEDVRSFLRWAGEDFDPTRFDRHAANAALLRMAWNRWGTK